MKHRIFRRILTGAVVIPLFLVLSITPAHAILGSILAGIQRYQIIANQITQIYKDTMAKITFDGQLTEMIGQAAHLKEQALGTVGALTDPFTKLASVPTRFIGLGLSWKNDFTGIPRGIASSVENMGESGKSFRESWEQRLTDADTVSESDILNLFQDSSPEGAERASRAYLAAREGSDKRLVLDHATSTVATNLIVAACCGLLRALAGKHQHIQHRACSIASHRSSDARPPHRCHGSVDGIPGSEGSGRGLRKRDHPARSAGRSCS